MVLSVEITSRNIYMVEGNYKKGHIMVSNFATVPTPEGAVRQGALLNLMELTAAIHSAMEQFRFRAREVSFSVASSATLFRDVTVPAVRKKEMRPLLLGQMDQMNTNKQDYVMDYYIAGKNAEAYEVKCILLPRILVESYHELAHRLRLKPRSLDVPVNGVRKLAALDERSWEGAVIVAGISQDEIRMTLIENTGRMFYRCASLDVAHDVVESEFILSSLGTSGLLSDEVKQDQIVGGASEQISKLIQFQQIKNRGAPVFQVVLYVELADSEGIVERIASNVDVPCITAAKPAFVKCSRSIPYAQYMNAVSMVIEMD